MQDRDTNEAIRLAEHLVQRTDALSGMAVAISAATRNGNMTGEEVFQMLDLLASDFRRNAEALLAHLVSAAEAADAAARLSSLPPPEA